MNKANERLEELRRRKGKLRSGGDAKIRERLHRQGMLTARERLDKLLDKGSFVELDMFVTHHCVSFDMPQREVPCDGVITGYGEIEGRAVFVYSQDYSAMMGTLGKSGALKIAKVMDMACQRGAPFIGINHSAGARLQEVGRGEMGGPTAFGGLFYRHSIYSGVIPQISLMMGDNAGGQVYGPGLTDFVLATKQSNLFIAGPPLVKSVIGEDVSPEELGGAAMHASLSGVVHVIAENDEDCLAKTRRLIGYLPSSAREMPPFADTGDSPDRLCPELEAVLPDSNARLYDMHSIITPIVDGGSFFEIHERYARNIIIGLARFAGSVTGIIAANPVCMAGAIDVKAAEKAARFVRFCDAFNIPLVYLQDNPAYIVGTVQEQSGMIYRGATLLYATSVATVPIVTVIIRKGLGGAYIAMGSYLIGGDINYAWPTADMAGAHPEGITDVIYRREIGQAAKPGEARERLVEQCREELGSIYDIASWQHVNDIIEPKETRRAIIAGLKMTRNKVKTLPAKKHGNMPL